MGLISSAITAIGGAALNKVGDALGMSQLARETAAKKELAEHQYQLNEKAAENAFLRTKEMNEITYNQQSYENQRRQMENAGLSVGLMYGGGAGGGGGAGSTTPQAAGGAAPQSATAGADMFALSLEMRRADAEVRKAEAEAKKAEAEAKNTDQRTDFEKELKPILKENQRQEGLNQWLANVGQKYAIENGITEEEYHNSVYDEDLKYNPESHAAQMSMAERLDAMAAVYEKIGKANEAEAATVLKGEEARWYFQTEVVPSLAKGDLDRAEAYAKRIASGEEANWKSIIEVGLDVINTGVNAANAAARWKIGTKIIDGKAVRQIIVDRASGEVLSDTKK